VQQLPHQAHVVMERQPAADPRVRTGVQGLLDHPLVRQQIAVRDHDAPGITGGPRGVLQEGEAVGRDAGHPPVVRIGQPRLVGSQAHHVAVARAGQQLRQRGGVHRVGEHQLGRGVADHPGDPLGLVPGAPGRRDRHGHGGGVETAEEGGGEQPAALLGDQHPLALGSVLAQPHRQPPRLAVQVSVGEGVEVADSLA
jgi:hypothetical protein